MNKRKTIHRLVATGLMTAFTAASLVTTSFAFVTLNTNASISEFSFEIVDQEGLLLSTDGDKFYQDIDYETIKNAICANNDNASSLSDISLTGVTLGGRATAADDYEAGLFTEEYSYKIGQNVVEITDKRLTFIKDKVTWLDQNDSNDATAITAASASSTTLKNLLDENDRIGVHSYEAATNSDYIFFDLWLRVAQNGLSDSDEHPTYNLKFSNRTVIEGSSQNVELYNDLTIPSTAVPTNNTHLDGTAISDGKYKAGDKITVNPANAMRLGVNVLGSSKTNQDTGSSTVGTYDFTNSLKIYEPNEGLGSYAVTDGTSSTYSTDKYNPQKNAMFTYYNNLNPLRPFVAGVAETDALKTDSTFTDDVLTKFEYKNGSYNVVKLSVMLWLEGWDSDYFVGLNNTAINVKLGFEITEA